MRLLSWVAFAATVAAVPQVSYAQGADPRTAPGQLAACGGAAAWSGIGFLDFTVEIEAGGSLRGPWRYRWDRRSNYFRITGAYPAGGSVDLALDIGSRSGGGWRDGEVLTGEVLAEIVNWAFARFGEDLLWLTFPLEWGAPGITVTPGPESNDEAGRLRLTTTVVSPSGRWLVWIEPASGLVARTVFERSGAEPLTLTWSDWRRAGGIFFARMRTVAETGETVRTTVTAALPSAPADAF